MQVHSIRVFVGDTVLGTCTKCLATATHRVAQKSVMIVNFVRSALNFTVFTIIKLGESNFTIINANFFKVRWESIVLLKVFVKIVPWANFLAKQMVPWGLPNARYQAK